MSQHRPAKKRVAVSVGESVRIIRELQGLSQERLASLSGIKQATLSAIENNRARLGVERAKVLARALRCHPAVLVFPGWEQNRSRRRPDPARRRRLGPSATPGLVGCEFASESRGQVLTTRSTWRFRADIGSMRRPRNVQTSAQIHVHQLKLARGASCSDANITVADGNQRGGRMSLIAAKSPTAKMSGACRKRFLPAIRRTRRKGGARWPKAALLGSASEYLACARGRID
jgi:transcriptional regulator with XRE-family HTH domain